MEIKSSILEPEEPVDKIRTFDLYLDARLRKLDPMDKEVRMEAMGTIVMKPAAARQRIQTSRTYSGTPQCIIV